MAEKSKSDEAWEQLLVAHPEIVSTIEAGGVYELAASEIKHFREPRLMTKHDTSEGVPTPLKKHGINVLPISRSAYVLGDFVLHEDFPDVTDVKPVFRTLPEFQTLKVTHLTSEANAINALMASGILNDFLNAENTVETFNGRMGTGDFGFDVNRKSGGTARVEVRGAQLEIDGGFENDDAVIIMEAKNVLHNNFHVRQLYYPYRKYEALVTKPIRLVFSQYTNLTYYLHEYEFTERDNYSSLNLLRTGAYTFEDARITARDLWRVWQETRVTTTDNLSEGQSRSKPRPPFIQADRFDRVISLMERLSNSESASMTTEEIAHFMGTVQRQADYYPAAGEYLGLFERASLGKTTLSARGQEIVKLGRRERQLAFASAMFEHEIFHRLFEGVYASGELPGHGTVMQLMGELNVCNSESTTHRRAYTVIAWLRWLMSIVNEDR